jgi:tetratricopeptide (TPR) repeat protein
VELGRAHEALESYDKAIELDQGAAEAHFGRGKALRTLGRLKEAAESYDRAIAINPRHAGAYKEGADLCAAAHLFTPALLLYENAIMVRPDFAAAHMARANVLWTLRRHDQALESSRKAVTIDPSLRFAPGLDGWDVNRNNQFPLPWNPVRILSGGREGPYVIGAMFTPGYSDKAARLAGSCEKFGLPYVMHEVPAVHRSISIRGSNDLSLTKANFVHHLLQKYEKPVLYVDADCEFVRRPDLLDELANSDCDFAIYNRLADAYTDTFVPLELDLGAGSANGKRFYRFHGGLNWFSTSQLMCCGLVQFYRNSDPARFLLSEWHRTIATFPEASDDEALRFAYNNLGLPAKALKARWLPMAYARISLWIYAEPVIDHPDLAQEGTNFRPLDDPSGRKSFYTTLMEWKDVAGLFPRGCIIDTEQRMVCKRVGEGLVPIKPFDHPLWL